MNNGPLTLILIAAFGLVIVLSLGVFFAVKPRSISQTRLLYYGLPPQDADNRSTTAASSPETRPVEYPGLKSLNYNVEDGKLRKTDETYEKPPPVLRNRIPSSSAPPPMTPRTLPPSPPPPPVNVEVVANPPIIIPSGQRENFKTAPLVTAPPPGLVTAPPVRQRTVRPRPSTAAPPPADNEEPYWDTERRMLYGKVVGLAFADGKLVAPAHDTGNISIFAAPELKLVEELYCPKCKIYDVAVLPNGDLVVAQGNRQKLSKIDRKENRIVKEIHLEYETKGLDVSPAGHIYVLTRSHERIKVYNEELEEVGLIFIPNDNHDDCNFLTLDKESRLIVSCETEVFIMEGGTGEYIGRIVAPVDTSYSMGVAMGPSGEILLAQRGRSVVDVYSPDGKKLIRSLGRRGEALWSDIAFGAGHAYVIDYIAATVKAIPY